MYTAARRHWSVGHIRRVAHQAPDHHVVPVPEYSRQPMLQCELGQKAGVVATGLRGRVDENGVDTIVRHGREGALVIRAGAHPEGPKLDAKLPFGSLGRLQKGSVRRGSAVP